MRKVALGMPWNMLPGLLVLCCVFYIPILVIFCLSFTQRIPGSFALTYWPPTLANYRAVFDPLYINVLISTFQIIFISTSVTLIIGFPLAIYIHKQRPAMRNLLLVLLILPFFANFLARIYAWFIIFKPSGVLHVMGIGGGTLLNTKAALVIGIVSTYLPFLVYPVYFSLERLDQNLIDAARNLGSSSFTILWRVTIPLCKPGIVAGVVMVALPALGEFIIAKMVGGGLVPLAAMMIETSFLGKVTPNWPFGAALSMLLMAAVMVGLLILKKSAAKETAVQH